jgi:hypothetical protein
MAGFISDILTNGGSFTKILSRIKNVPSFGMKYEDMIVKNSQAISRAEGEFLEKGGGLGDEDTEYIYAIADRDTGGKKYIGYFDSQYPFKRDFLKKFALNSEIEWILDTMCDEGIVYDDKNFFCHPSLFSLDLKDDVIESIRENFKIIYTLIGFSNKITAWEYFRDLLIEGIIAFEIIYSDTGKKIIGFKRLDPVSLVPSIKINEKGEKIPVWYQYVGDPNMSKELMDNQIIYISYTSGTNISRISYTERLIRSYNLLRIMEQTRIIWNVMNASYRLKFVVPVGTRSQQKAKETLGELMALYKEEIKMDATSGELTVNGRPNIQFFKNYLFPQQGGQGPTVSRLNAAGPDLSSTEVLTYFVNKLKQDSKIPFSRFAARSGGAGGQFKIAAESAERDEVRFSKFLNRLRSIFQEIVIKPLWIQMCLDYPELKEDLVFASQLGVKFNSDNIFGQSIEIENTIKSIDFINGMMDLKEKSGDEEISYFSQDFLIKRWLDLSAEDLRLNKLYLEKEEEEAKKEEEKRQKEAKEAEEKAVAEAEASGEPATEEAPTEEAPTEEAPTEEAPEEEVQEDEEDLGFTL